MSAERVRYRPVIKPIRCEKGKIREIKIDGLTDFTITNQSLEDTLYIEVDNQKSKSAALPPSASLTFNGMMLGIYVGSIYAHFGDLSGSLLLMGKVEVTR